jgi:hypothetical protein
MTRALISFPVRLSVRSARLVASELGDLAEWTFGLVGVASELVRSRDQDARGHDGAPRPPAPPSVSSPPPPAIVLESADAGAEDGAGAQVRVAEPWSGYDQLGARDVIERLAAATPAELAAVELYEGSKRRRKTVLAEAERRLAGA